MELRSRYHKVAPGALPVLARLLQGRVEYLSATLHWERGRPWVEPHAIVARNLGVQVPAFSAESTLDVPLAHFAERPVEFALDEAHELLIRAVHRGLRFPSQDGPENVAARLRDEGFEQLAERMAAAGDSAGWLAAALRLYLTRHLLGSVPRGRHCDVSGLA